MFGRQKNWPAEAAQARAVDNRTMPKQDQAANPHEPAPKPVITRERFEALEKGVTDGHADIRNKLGNHDEMIRRLDTRTLRQGKTITYKFEQRNQRQKVLEERVDAFEGRFTNLAGLFKRVGDDLAKRVDAIEGKDVVKGVNHRIDNLAASISDLAGDMTDIRTRLRALEKRDADTVMKDAGGPEEGPQEPDDPEPLVPEREKQWRKQIDQPTAWARLDEAIDDLAKDFGTQKFAADLKALARIRLTSHALDNPVPTTAGRIPVPPGSSEPEGGTDAIMCKGEHRRWVRGKDIRQWRALGWHVQGEKDTVTMRRRIGEQGDDAWEFQYIGTKDIAFAKQQGFEVIP